MDRHPGRGEPTPPVHEFDLLAQALHARYRCGGLDAAAGFAAAVAQALGDDAAHLSASISPRAVEFRLATPGVAPWVTEADLTLSRTISEVATRRGLELDATAVPEACGGRRSTAFWAALLTGDPRAQPPSSWDPGSLVRLPRTGEAPARWHLDLWLTPEVAEARIEAALAVGGRVVDGSARPTYTVLADPGGNQACIGTVLAAESPLPG